MSETNNQNNNLIIKQHSIQKNVKNKSGSELLVVLLPLCSCIPAVSEVHRDFRSPAAAAEQRRLGVCRSLHRREKRTERAEGLDSPEPESRTMQEEDDLCLLALVSTHPLCFKP